jgi:hypothetical protein
MPDGLDMLTWLPRVLPEGIRMIISLKEDGKVMRFYPLIGERRGKEEKKQDYPAHQSGHGDPGCAIFTCRILITPEGAVKRNMRRCKKPLHAGAWRG